MAGRVGRGFAQAGYAEAAAATMPLFGHLFGLHPYSAAFWIGAIRVAGYLGWMGLSARGDSWRPDGV